MLNNYLWISLACYDFKVLGNGADQDYEYLKFRVKTFLPYYTQILDFFHDQYSIVF